MGVIKRIIKYDMTRIPHAFIDFLFSFTFQIMILSTIYYGGMGLLAYYIFKLPEFLISMIWITGSGVSAGFIVAFPGLFYLNKPDITNLFIIIALGPLTLPKAFVCYLSFRINVGTDSLRKYDMSRMPIKSLTTHRSILRKQISAWNIDDPWMNAIKRNVDIGIPSFWDKCRRKWRLIVRIAKWRIV